jgi:hypothetical protein
LRSLICYPFMTFWFYIWNKNSDPTTYRIVYVNWVGLLFIYFIEIQGPISWQMALQSFDSHSLPFTLHLFHTYWTLLRVLPFAAHPRRLDVSIFSLFQHASHTSLFLSHLFHVILRPQLPAVQRNFLFPFSVILGLRIQLMHWTIWTERNW